MTNKIKSRVIVPHSKTCFMKDQKYPFSGIVLGTFYGNYAANEKAEIGRHHYWIKIMCNDPSCHAIKAVHSSVLVEA